MERTRKMEKKKCRKDSEGAMPIMRKRHDIDEDLLDGEEEIVDWEDDELAEVIMSEFFNDLRAHIRIVGGVEKDDCVYRKMKLGELMDTVYPNGIRFRVYNHLIGCSAISKMRK